MYPDIENKFMLHVIIEIDNRSCKLELNLPAICSLTGVYKWFTWISNLMAVIQKLNWNFGAFKLSFWSI